MDKQALLADKIISIGFECTRCGICCTQVEQDSNLVMVMPAEVRRIMKETGLQWNDIAEPYPECIETPEGQTYTLGWCIRRDGSSCRFHKDNACRIHKVRPWICRTYPFMLDCDELVVCPCPGIGKPVSREQAYELAAAIIERKESENAEEQNIRARGLENKIPRGYFVVIDSEGVWRLPVKGR